MKEFFAFYRWGMTMKFHMAIYTIALLSVKSVVNLLQGINTVSIWTMLQMLLVSMALAILESVVFPQDGELTEAERKPRTLLWVVAANLLFIGGAVLLGWFPGLPVWGVVVLLGLLEFGLVAMWVGLHIALKKDTQQMNKNLQDFKGKQ